MSVSTQHKLYIQNFPKWELVRDCVEGSQAIKSRNAIGSDSNESNLAGTRYLPQPNPTDNSAENTNRYAQYRTRANFVGFTSHTKDGLTGMVYRKAPEINLNSGVEYLNENSNGAGLTLLQSIQSTTSNVLDTGRHGLLTDFPTSDGGSQAQTKTLKANVLHYRAESILNWRTTIINGEEVLTLVVLAEEVELIDEDGFGGECVTWYRVLRLNESGIYTQEVYNENEEPIIYGDGDDSTTEIIPRKSDGSTWDKIPFVFVGAQDNDPTPDKSPLYDLAELNIAHYRNSADFEESSFLVGQPTPVISGLTQPWVDEVMKGGVMLGSRSAVLLPDGGSAMLLQAKDNQMPSKGMEEKEKQMIKIGAKIITDAGGVETAEAAKLRFAGQNSKLSLVINNVEQAYQKVFEWVAEFMPNADGENVFEINRQFYEATVDPQLIIASMQLQDRGVIGKTDLRNTLRKSGQIATNRTDKDIDAEVGNIDPLESSVL